MNIEELTWQQAEKLLLDYTDQVCDIVFDAPVEGTKEKKLAHLLAYMAMYGKREKIDPGHACEGKFSDAKARGMAYSVEAQEAMAVRAMSDMVYWRGSRTVTVDALVRNILFYGEPDELASRDMRHDFASFCAPVRRDWSVYRDPERHAEVVKHAIRSYAVLCHKAAYVDGPSTHTSCVWDFMRPVVQSKGEYTVDTFVADMTAVLFGHSFLGVGINERSLCDELFRRAAGFLAWDGHTIPYPEAFHDITDALDPSGYPLDYPDIDIEAVRKVILPEACTPARKFADWVYANPHMGLSAVCNKFKDADPEVAEYIMAHVNECQEEIRRARRANR